MNEITQANATAQTARGCRNGLEVEDDMRVLLRGDDRCRNLYSTAN
jgi:hypothetical protein